MNTFCSIRVRLILVENDQEKINLLRLCVNEWFISRKDAKGFAKKPLTKEIQFR